MSTNPAAPGAMSVTRLPGAGRILATWVIADHDTDEEAVTVVDVIDGSRGRLVSVSQRKRAASGWAQDTGEPSSEAVLYRASEVLVLAKVLVEADALAADIGAEVVPVETRRRHLGSGSVAA